MRTATWAQIRANIPRLFAVSIAIILSVAFVVGALAVSDAFNKTLAKSIAAEYESADVVVLPQGDDVDAIVETTSDVEGVTTVDPVQTASGSAQVHGRDAGMRITQLADDDLRWHTLDSGSWPSGDDEVTIDSSSAENFDVAVGDTLALTTSVYDEQTGDFDRQTTTATISGITASTGAITSAGLIDALATDAGLSHLADESNVFTSSILVSTSGASDDETAAAVAAALDDAGFDTDVQTHDEIIDSTVKGLTGGTNALLTVVLTFATIALFVAAIVIANTFQVLVAQRTRQLALLRCVGATAGQIRCSVYGEALATGLVGSALGVLAGYGLAAGASAVSQSGGSPIHLVMPSPNPWHIVIGMAIGTIVTLVAAIIPARRATRVLPIEALRPLDATALSSRKGLARLIVGFTLMAIGAALLVAGALGLGLGAGLPGGVICFVGVLMASSLLVPSAVRAVGSLFGFTGVPGRLASANAVRNPGRTATTAAALLVGTTLVSMVMVGAGSVEGSLVNELNESRPVDLVVAGQGAQGPQELSKADLAALDGVDHVDGVVAIEGVDTEIDDAQLELLGIPADTIGTVVHSNSLTPAANEVVMDGDVAEMLGVDSGDTIALNDDGHTFTVALSTQVPYGSLLVTDQALRSIASNATVQQAWLKVDASASATEIQDMMSSIQDAVPNASVTGAAPERALYSQVINTMMLVVVGLLAIAVVIALIGIGNTLALSVLERSRESSLLRALGLTKGQLRGMLSMEAVLISGVAALIGILLGMFFGWAGTGSITSMGDLPAVFVVPFGELAIVLGIAVIAGLLASVLPTRRATKLSPIEGLAME